MFFLFVSLLIFSVIFEFFIQSFCIIGWMDTEVFAEWFERFSNQITERPLLLLFDGHMTHVSLGVIKKALEDDIIIVKFPPHVTDILQPLDVSCFGPLKRKWEMLL